MAKKKRQALTYQMIAKTAKALESQGIKPSTNNIRENIGYGSFSTIKLHLDEYRGTKVSKQPTENVATASAPLHLIVKTVNYIDLLQDDLKARMSSLEGLKQQLLSANKELEALSRKANRADDLEAQVKDLRALLKQHENSDGKN